MDTRTEKTKKALRDAMFESLELSPVKDIQVQDVCKRAGIKRTTFYYHYNGLEDLINDIGQEQLNHLRDFLKCRTVSRREMLNTMIGSLERAKELYHTKDGGVISERFKADVLGITKEYSLPEWRAKLPNVDAKESELAFEAILAGAFQISIIADEKINRDMLVNTILDLVDSYFKSHTGEVL